MQRRTFLASLAAAGAAAAAAGCAPRPRPDYPAQSGLAFEGTGPYPAGVGSGDPTPNSVLLWTRVHPERDRGDGVPVRVQLATTPSFASVLFDATVTATAARDHCVTVDATGLEPGRTYWYRFTADGVTSPTGRTRTAPIGPLDHLRVAAFSCQRWTHGYFSAHADLAAMAEDPDTDVDLVLCLGDYVYETGYADQVYVPGRDDPIQNAVTQEQFRSKYRLYRSDPNLQAVHAAFPMVNIFDNHDGLSGPGDPQAAGAIAAFFEHLPVRTRLPGRIDRSLRWGDLAEVFVTDQRSFRDPTGEEAGVLGTSSEQRPDILDPGRTMLGADQRQWLVDGLTGSSARWKVLGSQLMFAPFRSVGRLPGQPRGAGVYLNMTQWDGYVGERLALLDALAANGTTDTVVLSGDSHFFAVSEVSPDVDDPYAVPRVVEFSTGSVTSNNADENNYPTDDITGPLLAGANSNSLRFFESERHGYVVLDLEPGELRAELRSPPNIRVPECPADSFARFRVAAGTQRIDRVF
ncbi:MAG: alkaline phosphatase D family protein [Microthrixaceae bacterium]